MKRKSAPEPDMTEGAAGLWARSLHASFIGNSPVKSPAMQGQGFFAVDPQITPAIGTPEEAFTPPALRNRVSVRDFLEFLYLSFVFRNTAIQQ